MTNYPLISEEQFSILKDKTKMLIFMCVHMHTYKTGIIYSHL